MSEVLYQIKAVDYAIEVNARKPFIDAAVYQLPATIADDAASIEELKSAIKAQTDALAEAIKQNIIDNRLIKTGRLLNSVEAQ